MGKKPRKPNPGGGGPKDVWTWIAAWVLSLVVAAGGGIALADSINEREKRERDNKWRELLEKEREKNEKDRNYPGI